MPIQVQKKTPAQEMAEMERIRAIDAKLKEEELKNFKPEPNTHKIYLSIEVGRYVTGQFKGSFVIIENIKDGKKSTRKVISDGVDLLSALASIETSIRRKVYK